MQKIPLYVSIVTVLLLSGCIGTTAVKRERVREVDEDGQIYDVRLGDMDLTNRSQAFFLGKILQQCPTYLPERNVHIFLYERDCRVIEKPIYGNVLTNTDFLAIVASTNDKRQIGPMNGNWSNCMLRDMINIVSAYSAGYVMDTYSDPKNLYFYIGPEEVVKKRWRRQAFRVPPLLSPRFESLPSVLPPHGACVGFDPGKNLLVVIDWEEANVFRLVTLIGCEAIGEEDAPYNIWRAGKVRGAWPRWNGPPR